MRDINFVASVAERDIDLLLLEELMTNEAFRVWFVTRSVGFGVYKTHNGAWHSVMSQNRESDLIYRFVDTQGKRYALLIENKIDAMAQPNQAAGYRSRGEAALNGDWEDFRICITAPQSYLESNSEAKNYDVRISYEEIVAFFASHVSDLRQLYKAQMVQEAIEKKRRGYQPEISSAMTVFVQSYYAYAQKSFSKLSMALPKERPAGNDWVQFKPDSLPKGVTLYHQMKAGWGKAFWNGAVDDVDALRLRYQDFLDTTLDITKAGRSASLSIKVPAIDPLAETFEQAQEKIEQALQALARIESVIRKVESQEVVVCPI